jgi:hypothetical protein
MATAKTTKATAKKSTATAPKTEPTWVEFNSIRLDFVERILAQKEIENPDDPAIQDAYASCDSALTEMRILAKSAKKWGQWVKKAERMMGNFDRASKYRKAAMAAKKAADKAAKQADKEVAAAS